MAYLLLNEGRVVDDLPESERLCRKFVDAAGGREFYMTWYGVLLRQVAVYPLHSSSRVDDERIARVEIDGSAEAVLRICQEWRIPQAWTVADYRR